MMLSGFMFPFQGMPGWARVVGEAVPSDARSANLSRHSAERQWAGADLARPMADGTLRGGGRYNRREYVSGDAGLMGIAALNAYLFIIPRACDSADTRRLRQSQAFGL